MSADSIVFVSLVPRAQDSECLCLTSRRFSCAQTLRFNDNVWRVSWKRLSGHTLLLTLAALDASERDRRNLFEDVQVDVG